MIRRLYALALNVLVHERGATIVEYGLLLALVAAVLVGVTTDIGQGLASKFTAASNVL